MKIVRKIVAAAIKQRDLAFSVARPGRHHNVIREMADAGIQTPIVGEQGFMTSDGIFVDRYRAFEIAERAGQIIRDKGESKTLFSEDLW